MRTVRLALAFVLLLAAPAHGATLTGGQPLVFTGEPGEVNTVTVHTTVAGITIADSTAELTTTANGCTSADAHTVSCEGTFTTLTADLGDANDQLTVTGRYLTLELAGGAGNDAIDLTGVTPVSDDARFGASGDDGDDELRGGVSDEVFSGGPGADVIDGADGLDEADYSDHADGILIDLTRAGGQGAQGEGDSLTGIESVFGGVGDDILRGNGEANFLRGNQGRDRLLGRGGGDTLQGDGHEVDEEDPGPTGGDSARGGGGRDRIEVGRRSTAYGEKGADSIVGPRSRLSGGAGDDYLGGSRGRTSCGAGRDTAALGEAPDFVAHDCEGISPFTPAQLVIGPLHLRGERFAVRLTCGDEPEYCRGRIRVRGRGGRRFRVARGRSEEIVLPRAPGRIRVVIDRIAGFGPIVYDTSL